MTRKPKTTAFWVSRLPHWEVEDGRYFVTIHLAGAIPMEGRLRIKALAAEVCAITQPNAPQWLIRQRAIFREMERWLDRAQWNPKLQQPEIAALVVEAIKHRQQRGDWKLFEYVVMPTHIHLFGEIGGSSMKETVNDFKRWTGHQAGKILKDSGARFWQVEWFDHWSRSTKKTKK